MVIISKTIINDFAVKHRGVPDALLRWYYTTKLTDWSNFAGMKRDFNSVDAVSGDRYVFNIKGNIYRLVRMITLIQETYISVF